jgi:hypothetical protein
MLSCGFILNRRFGGMFHLHLQGRRNTVGYVPPKRRFILNPHGATSQKLFPFCIGFPRHRSSVTMWDPQHLTACHSPRHASLQLSTRTHERNVHSLSNISSGGNRCVWQVPNVVAILVRQMALGVSFATAPQAVSFLAVHLTTLSAADCKWVHDFGKKTRRLRCCRR